jgi:hypothetical protein
MHPISRLRLDTHVALIRLRELPNGFRVLSAEAVSFESLPDKAMKQISDILLYNQTKQPEKVYCVAVFEVAIDAAHNCCIINGYIFGGYSDLAALQDEAAIENGRRPELINMLNNEL